jgi:Flp pilus assembly protein TadG
MPSTAGDLPRPPRRRPGGEPGDERGDVVLGWLTRIALALTVTAVVAFDGVSVVTSRLGVQDDAADAARAASQTWQERHDVSAALSSADQAASADNPTNAVDVATFRLDADGTAHVTVRREAPTILIRYVGPARRWAQVHARVSTRSTI